MSKLFPKVELNNNVSNSFGPSFNCVAIMCYQCVGRCIQKQKCFMDVLTDASVHSTEDRIEAMYIMAKIISNSLPEVEDE